MTHLLQITSLDRITELLAEHGFESGRSSTDAGFSNRGADVGPTFLESRGFTPIARRKHAMEGPW